MPFAGAVKWLFLADDPAHGRLEPVWCQRHDGILSAHGRRGGAWIESHAWDTRVEMIGTV